MEKEENESQEVRLYVPLAHSIYLPLDLLAVPQLQAHLDPDVCSQMSHTSRESQYITRIASCMVFGITKGYCRRNYCFSENTFDYYF